MIGLGCETNGVGSIRQNYLLDECQAGEQAPCF